MSHKSKELTYHIKSKQHWAFNNDFNKFFVDDYMVLHISQTVAKTNFLILTNVL